MRELLLLQVFSVVNQCRSSHYDWHSVLGSSFKALSGVVFTRTLPVLLAVIFLFENRLDWFFCNGVQQSIARLMIDIVSECLRGCQFVVSICIMFTSKGDSTRPQKLFHGLDHLKTSKFLLKDLFKCLLLRFCSFLLNLADKFVDHIIKLGITFVSEFESLSYHGDTRLLKLIACSGDQCM